MSAIAGAGGCGIVNPVWAGPPVAAGVLPGAAAAPFVVPEVVVLDPDEPRPLDVELPEVPELAVAGAAAGGGAAAAAAAMPPTTILSVVTISPRAPPPIMIGPPPVLNIVIGPPPGPPCWGPAARAFCIESTIASLSSSDR